MLSRILNAVLLVLAGLLVGAVGTVAHPIDVTWGVGIPLGLIGALLAYTSLLVGLRLLAATRVPAILAALGAIATVLLFAQQSPGGSVLIPNTLAGQIWLVAPILIAAVVVAWPDVRRRPARPELAAAMEPGPAVSE
ncbi:hypothetical protein LLS1_23480 [Leifsonia sp. LS1]|uniref:hypothetical protein n=1 Tax=Leifsonia sp. LS1 TaxID=2828483 RepID=UPI001CFF18E2|nr:hypothetical protein [Leifsonia sp. LS1]GIT80679.1 hypothetical protein LLS1_23480 [Leifsonia sp. LS1]